MAAALLSSASCGADVAAPPPLLTTTNSSSAGYRVAVSLPAGSAAPVRFAALNLRRYLHVLGLGALAPLRELRATPAAAAAAAASTPPVTLLISAASNGAADAADAQADADASACALPAGAAFAVCRPSPTRIALASADAEASLRATVHVLNLLGITFGLDGVQLPPAAAPPPRLFEVVRPFAAPPPAFGWRGLQPFHDFAEGPDLWSEDAWAAVVESVALMGGNAIGMHTYPYANAGSPPGIANNLTGSNEPAVWLGPPSLVNGDGTVQAAYPTAWANSLRHEWAYWPRNTSSYFAGAAELFPHECFGHPVQSGDASVCPWPVDADAAVTLFDRVGALWQAVFGYARAVGVRTILGTEAPMSLPPFAGVNTSAPGADELYYAGAFTRLLRLLGENLTAYWVWTPESFEWSKVPVSSPAVQAVVRDLAAATAAHDSVGATFELATCGWVVGPAGNRAYLDGVIDPAFTISSIGTYFGEDPVDPAYSNITRHATWYIPWLEGDPWLTGLELFVNRTLQRNREALALGVSGLLNIHWRTRSVAPQAAASHAFALNTSLALEDFWLSWAAAQFGAAVAPAAAAVFSSIDGPAMPTPVTWITGPGTIEPSAANCATVANGSYEFAESFAALRPSAVAASDLAALERFDYWLTSFRYMRALALTSCAWSDYNAAIKNVTSLPAGPARVAAARSLGFAAWARLVANATFMQWSLLSSASSTGELGSAMNTQGQSLLQHAIGGPMQQALASLADLPALPANLSLPTAFDAARVPLLRVFAARTGLARGDALRVEARVVAHPRFRPLAVTLFVGPLGGGGGEEAFDMPPAAGDGTPRMVFAAAVPGASLAPQGVQWRVVARLPPNETAFEDGGADALLPSPGASFFAGENITLMWPVDGRVHTVVLV